MKVLDGSKRAPDGFPRKTLIKDRSTIDIRNADTIW